MNALKNLDQTLSGDHLNNFGSIVHDNKAKDQVKTCVIVKYSPPDQNIAKFGHNEMIAHQNRVRAITGILLAANSKSPFMLEDLSSVRRNNGYFMHDIGLANGHTLKSAHGFEANYGRFETRDGADFYQIYKQFDDIRGQEFRINRHLGIGPTENQLFKQFQGTFRQAGALIKSGQANRVHGLEPNSQNDNYGSHDLLKYQTAVDLIRSQIKTNSYGVIAVDYRNTNFGTPAFTNYYKRPGIDRHIHTALPDTRIIVVEPSDIGKYM